MNREKIDSFFKKHNFRTDYECLITEVKESIMKDASLALNGEKTSIQMIDTRYCRPQRKTCEIVLSIDVGGTNTRKVILGFNEEGRISASEVVKTKTDELMKGDFFENLANFVLDYTKMISSIALCFSYPFSPTDDGDGIINASAKGVDVDSLKNKKLVKTLIEKLCDKGMSSHVKGTVINDAVASLFNLTFQDFMDDIKIGSIIGTGCNVSLYIEKNGAQKAICTETGHAVLTPSILSDFDKDVDKETSAQGLSNFEGATSGYYLFRLIRAILKRALNEGVFIGDEQKEVEEAIGTLTDGAKIDEIFLSENLESVKYISDAVIHRAATIVSGMFTAFAHLSNESMTRKTSDVSILIEGTTYYKTHNYKKYVENLTKQELAKNNFNVKFYAPYEESAPGILLGTALSTL